MPTLPNATETLAGGVVRDIERVTRNRRGLWLAGALELIGLAIFVVLFNVLPFDSKNHLADWQLIGLGLVLSLVPAILWLLFFYQFDRLEPEPKRKVLEIFIIAGLLTAGISQPFLRTLFDVDQWLYNQWWTHLFGGILLIGIIHTFVVYLTLRYGIYFNPEFDERVDGVIYGTAAGLGVATVLNFAYIFQHGGVDLGVGSIRMVVNALAYASFAGILGYCLGQTRFEKTPFYYLPFGFMLSATLNGLFFFLEDRVTSQGLQSTPLNGLFLATILAAFTLVMLFWLIQRANEETLRVGRAKPAPFTPLPDLTDSVLQQETTPPPSPEPSIPQPPPPPPSTTREELPPSPSPLPPQPPIVVVGDDSSDDEIPLFADIEEVFPNKDEVLAEVKASWEALMQDLRHSSAAEDEGAETGEEEQ